MLTPEDTPIAYFDSAFVGETLWFYHVEPQPPKGVVFSSDGGIGRAYVPDARRFSLDDGTLVYEAKSLAAKGRKLNDDQLIRLSQGCRDNPVNIGGTSNMSGTALTFNSTVTGIRKGNS